MLAFTLRESGWYLRQEIIWHKPNPMPESVRDRCTKSHESLFLLTQNKSNTISTAGQCRSLPCMTAGKALIRKPGKKYLQENTGAPVQSLTRGGRQ
jgi:hypothetical protein